MQAMHKYTGIVIHSAWCMPPHGTQQRQSAGGPTALWCNNRNELMCITHSPCTGPSSAREPVGPCTSSDGGADIRGEEEGAGVGAEEGAGAEEEVEGVELGSSACWEGGRRKEGQEGGWVRGRKACCKAQCTPWCVDPWSWAGLEESVGRFEVEDMVCQAANNWSG